MTNATATEPLADVQEGDSVIRERSDPPFTTLDHVTRRTTQLFWIGPVSYRFTGLPANNKWAHHVIRLPKPGEVLGLQVAQREKARQRTESGKQYSRKRERYIALIYAAARAGERDTFIDLLGHWETGNWDDDLDRIDAANQSEG